MTRPVLRPQAEVDLVERAHYYRAEGGSDLGERFFDAAITALDAIGRMPGAGSPRVGELCGIDGLHVRRIPNFPCGWFYFASGDRIDVVRLLADAQEACVIGCDNIITIFLEGLDDQPVGHLDEITRARLDEALRYSLDIVYQPAAPADTFSSGSPLADVRCDRIRRLSSKATMGEPERCRGRATSPAMQHTPAYGLSDAPG